jgi:hypothetical protein
VASAGPDNFSHFISLLVTSPVHKHTTMMRHTLLSAAVRILICRSSGFPSQAIQLPYSQTTSEGRFAHFCSTLIVLQLIGKLKIFIHFQCHLSISFLHHVAVWFILVLIMSHSVVHVSMHTFSWTPHVFTVTIELARTCYMYYSQYSPLLNSTSFFIMPLLGSDASTHVVATP